MASPHNRHQQLMVVALVQKCTRDAKAKGCEPPTDLGFLLQEFFDFYGNQLDYATTGEAPYGTLPASPSPPVDQYPCFCRTTLFLVRATSRVS